MHKSMISRILHKSRQIAQDPQLRRWLIGRMLGKWPGEPVFKAHQPDYLTGLLPLSCETPAIPETAQTRARQHHGKAFTLSVPGQVINAEPGQLHSVFAPRSDDLEIHLACHRFALVMDAKDDDNIENVYALWRVWCEHYATSDGGWPWHPYTAAERAVNMIRFFNRHGWPEPVEDTALVLARHAPVIAEKLEFFGDHHTSNHLANNGRGLFLLGLKLGLPKAASLGALILSHEAGRIFEYTGMLREGSSHYHLLLTRNYIECAMEAKLHHHPLATNLTDIALCGLGAAAQLDLPGGFPLIGDISPDCPPDFLFCLLPGVPHDCGWGALLTAAEQQLFQNMKTTAVTYRQQISDSGWHSHQFGNWHGIWHVAPMGWSHMPGHGHQDMGSFQLHFGNVPVFIDPGRGAYGETGDAALYRSAHVHNSLVIDDQDPYPANKPYYSDDFRRACCGPPPHFEVDENSVQLDFGGYSRLPGVGHVHRRWEFKGNTLRLIDSVQGRGRHHIRRRLVTPLIVTPDENGLILSHDTFRFRLSSAGPFHTRPITRWTAYGVGEEVTAIERFDHSRLPYAGDITLERLT